jgi:signal transduction histidine kinase
MKGQAQARQVLVTVEGPEKLPVWLDARAIQHAVEELLSNAIRVTRYGGKVKVELEPGSGGRLRVKLTDEGPGFGNALPDTVFDPFLFHRTASAAGFGLALARKVAREHGGDVTLGSAKGGGEVVMEIQDR